MDSCIGNAHAAALAAPVPCPVKRRSCRVLLLTGAIAAMSLADLHITLIYLRSVGMGEANPLARWLMIAQSPSVLIWWKLALVTLTCVIFYVTRKHRSAEVAAWIGCFVLTWLTVRWINYSYEVSSLTPVIHHLSTIETGKWVQFGP